MSLLPGDRGLGAVPLPCSLMSLRPHVPAVPGHTEVSATIQLLWAHQDDLGLQVCWSVGTLGSPKALVQEVGPASRTQRFSQGLCGDRKPVSKWRGLRARAWSLGTHS